MPKDLYREYRHGPKMLVGGGCGFEVWAPKASRVDLHLLSPLERVIPMERTPKGYFRADAKGPEHGSLYRFVLDGSTERPDPASRRQPQGVHGPSQIVDPAFEWRDEAWRGLPLHDYIVYELHVGAFTPEGTFGAIVPHLAYLRDLGITVLELMPVAQFPGSRNWGYDGVYPFAVQESYGGAPGLKRLVDACHAVGLAVALDVVYNHLGPEGNYLASFGPYFTGRYQTPWGEALNYDGPGSDEVRRFFIENALYWISEFHIDALRLDAIHAIFDQSAYPFLQELGDAVHGAAQRMGRQAHVIAESDLNDPRFVRPARLGGMGLDAVWNDDFHHALHTLLTGERTGYYRDFGAFGQMEKACREGFVYDGRHSEYRERRFGRSSRTLPGSRMVVFAQNHDQVGNRMLGERLSRLVDFESLKLAAAAVLLAPFLPLLFMGEEYAEAAPFLYFTSHSDAALIQAVRDGRRAEFAGFAWQGEPPDPQDAGAFAGSKLDHRLRAGGRHAALLSFYKELIRLRKTAPSLAHLIKKNMETIAFAGQQALLARRWSDGDEIVVLLAFGTQAVAPSVPVPEGCWRKVLDSSDEVWAGPGAVSAPELAGGRPVDLDLNSRSAVVYRRTQES